jgi:dihydropteroate synthase
MKPGRQSQQLRLGSTVVDCSARTLIMGIVNVTPDSFSDGGRFRDAREAAEHALMLVQDGADILDIGGESTRPRGQAYGDGAHAVSAAEELRRVIPVIEHLAAATSVPISVDTTKSEVARQALEAGAVMVNDISGFRYDRHMPEVVAEAGAAAVVMHVKGSPQTMQQDPRYDDLFGEILAYLREGLRLGSEAGVSEMVVDPGLGFGKTVRDNYRILAGLERFHALGRPVLIGPSKKSFLGAPLGLPIGERQEASLAALVAGILGGASIVRVHDVREARRAAAIADAVLAASRENDTPPG